MTTERRDSPAPAVPTPRGVPRAGPPPRTGSRAAPAPDEDVPGAGSGPRPTSDRTPAPDVSAEGTVGEPAPTGGPPARLGAAPGADPSPRAQRGPLPLLRRAPSAPPAVVAHRGSSATAPENTLPALRAARRAGGSWVETDLRRTSDGVAVLLHDPRLERTTDGAGELAGTTAAELSRLDAGSWFSPEHAGAGVPRLADLVAWAGADPEVHLLLELKGDWSPSEVVPVVDAVRAAALGARSVLQAFEPATVAALAAAAPDLARALLLRTGGPVDAGAADEVERLVVRHDLAAVNPGDRLVLTDPSLVGRLHRLGVAVWVWTVDEADRWGELDAAQVDGVITNDPARMLSWVAGRTDAPSHDDVAA